MSFQPPANLYSQGGGTRPESVEVPFPYPRAPLASDNIYPVGKRWIDTAAQETWTLVSFSSINGLLSANWVLDGSSGSDIITITGNVGGPVPGDINRNVDLVGAAGQVVVTGTPGTNTLTISLQGGSTAIDTLIPGSGINVVPDATGNVHFPNGNGIATVGTANTMTVNMASPFTGAFTFAGNAGNQGLSVTNTGSSNVDMTLGVDTGNAALHLNSTGAQYTIANQGNSLLGYSNGSSLFSVANGAVPNWNFIGNASFTSTGQGNLSSNTLLIGSGSLATNSLLTVNGNSTNVQVAVNNTSATGSSLIYTNVATGTGNSAFATLVNTNVTWIFGNHQSASNAFVISSGGVLGTNNALSISTSGVVTISDSYTLPATAGTANYVLTTNGTNAATWQPSGGPAGAKAYGVFQVPSSLGLFSMGNGYNVFDITCIQLTPTIICQMNLVANTLNPGTNNSNTIVNYSTDDTGGHATDLSTYTFTTASQINWVFSTPYPDTVRFSFSIFQNL